MQRTLLGAMVLSGTVAFGSLVVEETFDYPLNNNIGSATASGLGLTGTWQRTFTDTASANLRVVSYTAWDAPANTFSPSNRRVETASDQTNSAAVQLAPLAHIDFGVEGVTYYSYLLSYLLDNRSRVSFGSAATPDLVRTQGLATGSLRVYVGGDFSVGTALAEGRDYLVVGRISAGAFGTTEHRVWVYNGDQSVPATDPGTAGSYAAHEAAVAGTADMLQFSNLIDASYGDFRMGATWASVAIPEPSTLFLLLAPLAGVTWLRRRWTS